MMTRKLFPTLLVLLLMPLLMGSGCDEKFQVTPEFVRQVAADANSLQASMDTYQALERQVSEILKTTGVVPVDWQGKLTEMETKINREIDRLQPQILAVAQAVESGRYTGDNSTVTMLEAIRHGNRASAPFNPYWAYIDAGLMLAILILGWLAKKKAAEAAAGKEAITEIVAGVEQAKQSDGSIKSVLSPAFSAAQSVKTQQMVAGIRKSLAVS